MIASGTRPIAFVGSSGGHLAHLMVLRPWWVDRNRFWVTFDKPDARSVLAEERVYWCHFPTNRHVWNLVRNTLLALRVLLKERPRLVISAGGGVAVPFFYVGKILFGTRNLFIEVVDRTDGPTLTGRLVRPVTDQYVVQWPEQVPFYPGAKLIGRLL